MSVKAIPGSQIQAAKPLISGKKFDVIFLVAILWFLLGESSDAWAHNNIPRLESPWTLWHGILYSGLTFLAVSLFAVLLINRQRGASWLQAIPKGYLLTYFAVLAMGFVGAADLTWHALFGVEQNLDALFSPTHLTAIACVGIFATGPLCSLYLRRNQLSTFSDYFLLANAFALPYVMLSIALQTFSIFTATWPDVTPRGDDVGQLAAIGAMMLQALIFTFFALYFTRIWTFKPGMFTYILGLMSVPLAAMHQNWFTIPVFVIGGFLIDVAYWSLQPSRQRLLQMRFFSAIAAAAPFAVYITWVWLTTSVVWTVHMMVGSVYFILMAGFALSYLAYPGKPLELIGSQTEPD